MKSGLRQKLITLSQRIEEIDRHLATPEATNDMNEFRRISKERAELQPVVTLYHDFSQQEALQTDAKSMLNDSELGALAQEDLQHANKRLDEITEQLRLALLPKDPNDDKNILLEIRAGTGGEESALFAGTLFRMYSRYAENQRWQIEIISASESDLGGFREIIARIIGEGAYSCLKFESGVHRVQRVPETETQGRIHTSAATVAILPEVAEITEIDLDMSDIRVDVFRASGAGGQHVNRTESAVRLTHLPTGIVAECQDGRSQHQNREQAMRVLASRILDLELKAQNDEITAARRSMVGSGDRSERIRTYNFPQGRLTDHRINLTLYKLEAVLEGQLEDVINALTAEHQANLLASLNPDD